MSRDAFGAKLDARIRELQRKEKRELEARIEARRIRWELDLELTDAVVDVDVRDPRPLTEGGRKLLEVGREARFKGKPRRP